MMQTQDPDPGHGLKEALREARAKNQALIEHLPAVFYEDMLGDEGIVTTFVSPQIEELLGVAPDGWVGDAGTWERHLHPDDRARATAAYLDALDGGRPATQEYRMVGLDGAEVWVRDEFTIIRDDTDASRVIQGMLFDITRQKTMESQLQQAEAQFRLLVEQIPAVLYIDLPQQDYDTAYVSPQIQSILGIDPDAWANADEDQWIAHIHPDDRDRVLREYASFLEGGADIADYRMVRPDGRTIWIRDRARTLRDEHGKAVLEQGVMIDVTEMKEAEAVTKRQVALLQKVDAISREFSDMILRGADLKGVLKGLTAVTKHPAVLEDAAHQLVEFSANETPIEKVLAEWEQHSRVGHLDDGVGDRGEDPRGIVSRETGQPPCAWIPIWLRDDLWGRLHLLEMDAAIDELDLLALDRAAAAVGMSLMVEREALNVADHAGSALVADILHGRSSSQSEILRRAKGLGADLKGLRLVALAIEHRRLAAGRELSERDRQQLTADIARDMRAAIRAAGCVGLAAPTGSGCLAIIGLPGQAAAAAVLDAIGVDLAARATDRMEGLSVIVGASEEVDAGLLGRALGEAAEAARYGGSASDQAGGGVRYFRDLGVQHLLAKLSEGPELARFVEAELKPLLEHDAGRAAPLLPTLRVFLEYAGSKLPAARALHIERRTLYHRLDRIEGLLHRDLDDYDVRVQLSVAIRGLDLLQDRGAGLLLAGDPAPGRR